MAGAYILFFQVSNLGYVSLHSHPTDSPREEKKKKTHHFHYGVSQDTGLQMAKTQFGSAYKKRAVD